MRIEEKTLIVAGKAPELKKSLIVEKFRQKKSPPFFDKD